MKKPEEIKKGLEYCANSSFCDEECPYFEECNEGLESHATDALAYIQQLESQVPRWIPVEERLPDTKLAVLGFGIRSASYGKEDPFAAVHVVYTRGEDEGWFTFWNQDYVEVTHWMPLPEAPKEDAHAPQD